MNVLEMKEWLKVLKQTPGYSVIIRHRPGIGVNYLVSQFLNDNNITDVTVFSPKRDVINDPLVVEWLKRGLLSTKIVLIVHDDVEVPRDLLDRALSIMVS